MSGVAGVVISLVMAGLVAWAALRAWRLRNVPLRIVSGVLASLAALLCLVVGLVGAVGLVRLSMPRGAPPATVTASVSGDRLATAARKIHGCTGCHSTQNDVPLDGGQRNFLSADGGPGLGVLVPPNLTPAGPLKDWSDGEIVRAIREGVDRDGHALMIMPSEDFHNLGDADVEGVVAFLRAQPAVEHATPARDVNLIGLLIVGAGLFPTSEQPHIARPQAAPPAAVTPEYGRYLVDITGCRTCHGPDLGGRAATGFGPPAGPSLRALIPNWAESQFVTFLRTGVDAYGRTLPPDSPMPWVDIGLANTDDELRAMYAYLHGLG